MLRRNDPKVVKLREDREKARVWLGILTLGCGEYLKGCYYSDEIMIAVSHINTELVQAAQEYKKLDKAYEPYWRRCRRVNSVRKPKKVVAKKVA